jgi:hypothetical protein
MLRLRTSFVVYLIDIVLNNTLDLNTLSHNKPKVHPFTFTASLALLAVVADAVPMPQRSDACLHSIAQCTHDEILAKRQELSDACLADLSDCTDAEKDIICAKCSLELQAAAIAFNRSK